MVTKTYNALEGQLSISATPTASQTGASNTVAIVGGYDAANAASGVTGGESTQIRPSNADERFGVSELDRAAQAVGANGVSDIYGVPVSETTTTESISSGTSITLSNTPLFNPDFHPDHDIVVTDVDAATELTVEIVYEDSPTQPTEDNTAKVNPINGTVKIDATGNYDIQYTYGDYSEAITTAADLPVRYVITLTESPTVKDTLKTELADRATDFDFKRGVVGASPEIAPTDIGNYTPDVEDWRVIEVAPALGTGASGPVRTAAAIGGFMAAQSIGPDGSGLYDEISGLSGLNESYRASNVDVFDQVTAITRNGRIGKAVTTSSVEQFQNIYATEIIDKVAKDLFDAARDYAGGPQDIPELEATLEIQCQDNANGSPPNLGFAQSTNQSPYNVTASLDPNDAGIANAGITIVPYPIAEKVNINLTAADGFVQFDGVSA